MKWTYKQLCQSLAETEYALRKGQKGFNTHGRHAQLEYMKQYYPQQHTAYVEAWEVRMTLPVDMKTILATIPERVTA